MKQMSRDPLAAAKARKAERRADEKSGGITIKPVSLPSADSKSVSGFKKGGFKNAFGTVNDEEDKDEKNLIRSKPAVEGFEGRDAESGSESDDYDCEYDPRRPTGCAVDCPGRA